MEDILKYENRDLLYQYFIDYLGFVKVEEKYYDQDFGNFYIRLAKDGILISYENDRWFMSVIISRNAYPTKWYSLSFVRDLIYDSENINGSEVVLDNAARINESNEFLKKDLDLILDLFNDQNYHDTKEKLDAGLKKTFHKRYPQAGG